MAVGLVPPVNEPPGPNVMYTGGFVPTITGGFVFWDGHCGFLQHCGSEGSGIRMQLGFWSYCGHLKIKRQNWKIQISNVPCFDYIYLSTFRFLFRSLKLFGKYFKRNVGLKVLTICNFPYILFQRSITL